MSSKPRQDNLFQAVQRESTLASRIASQIENLIIEKRLQAGERLPSERELAQQFGVSRTVIREAVRALAAKNLLEVQSGSGTTVRRPTAQTISQSIKLLLRLGETTLDYEKVHEVRRLLEVEIVGLAAQRRTDDDLVRLEAILREMASVQTDRDAFSHKDVEFHTMLAQATHNELFVVLLDSVVDIMIQVRQLGFGVAGALDHAREFHWKIVEQVRRGDANAARQIMTEHLLASEAIFRVALEHPHAEQPSSGESQRRALKDSEK